MEDRPLQVLPVEDIAADARLIQEMLKAAATWRFESTHDEDMPQIEAEALTKDDDRRVLEVGGRACSRSTGAAGPCSLSPNQSRGEQSHMEKTGDRPRDFDRRR